MEISLSIPTIDFRYQSDARFQIDKENSGATPQPAQPKETERQVSQTIQLKLHNPIFDLEIDPLLDVTKPKQPTPFKSSPIAPPELPQPVAAIHLNRPFLLGIRHKSTNAYLVIANIFDPRAFAKPAPSPPLPRTGWVDFSSASFISPTFFPLSKMK